MVNDSHNSSNLETAVVELLRRYREVLNEQPPRRIHGMVMNEVERVVIQEILAWAEFNQLEAARILGIHRNTLRMKIKQYNIVTKDQ